MGLQESSQEELKEVRKTISRFCSTVFQKWKGSHRILDRFLLYNSEWLDKKTICAGVIRTTHCQRSTGQDLLWIKRKKQKTEKRWFTQNYFYWRTVFCYCDEPPRKWKSVGCESFTWSRSYDAYQSIKNLPSLEWEEKGDCNVEIIGRWGALSVNWCAIVWKAVHHDSASSES